MNGAPIQPRDFVEAGLYGSKEEVIQEALAHLLEDRPDLRLDFAIYQYDVKGGISLGRAAELAGITRWELMDILVSCGVELRLGPATVEGARQAVANLEQLLRAQAD